MAVNIPTINELYLSIKGSLENRLGSSISTKTKSFLNSLTLSLAGQFKLSYLYLSNVQRNIFPDTADSESVGGTLERFGRVRLNRSPFPARSAQYSVTIMGDIGSTIQANTTFKSDDNSLNAGKIFIIDTSFTFTTTSGTITLRALEGGLNSSLNISDTLTATVPLLNIEQQATVNSVVIEPLNAEDLEDYREKVIESFRLEAQGGAGTDYRLWSFDAQGVRRVYPYARSGEDNAVDLFIEANVLDSIDGKGTPSTAIISTVESVVNFDPDVSRPLNERGRRPLTVLNIYYQPVNILNVDIVITNYNNLTALIQNQILEAVTDFVSNIRPFVASSDILADKNDILSTNNLIFTIQNAVNSSLFTNIQLSVDGNTVNSYTFMNGEIPFLNSINYV